MEGKHKGRWLQSVEMVGVWKARGRKSRWSSQKPLALEGPNLCDAMLLITAMCPTLASGDVR